MEEKNGGLVEKIPEEIVEVINFLGDRVFLDEFKVDREYTTLLTKLNDFIMENMISFYPDDEERSKAYYLANTEKYGLCYVNKALTLKHKLLNRVLFLLPDGVIKIN